MKHIDVKKVLTESIDIFAEKIFIFFEQMFAISDFMCYTITTIEHLYPIFIEMR